VNDTLLVLNLRGIPNDALNAKTARWEVWRLAGANHSASYLLEARANTGRPTLYWGDYAGRVGVFTTDTYADLGEGYAVEVQTKHSMMNAPTREKIFGDFYADIGPGGDYGPMFQAIFDFGRAAQTPLSLQMPTEGAFILGTGILGVTPLGGGTGIFRNKLYITGRGDLVSFKISHAGVNEPFFLHGLSGQVATFGEGSESAT
jgi:hypothetical protein